MRAAHHPFNLKNLVSENMSKFTKKTLFHQNPILNTFLPLTTITKRRKCSGCYVQGIGDFSNEGKAEPVGEFFSTKILPDMAATSLMIHDWLGCGSWMTCGGGFQVAM